MLNWFIMQNGSLAEFQFPKPLLFIKKKKKTPLWFQSIQLPGQVGFLLQGDMGLLRVKFSECLTSKPAVWSKGVSGRKRGRFWTAMGSGRELVCYSQYARKVSEKRQQEGSKEVTQDSPQLSKQLSLTNDTCFPFPLLILNMIIRGG